MERRLARKDPDKLDFVIVSQARSGSHMLATALDSHPDIACGGEVNANDQIGSTFGYVLGCLVKGAMLHRLKGFKGKYIHLTRKPEDIAASIQNSWQAQGEKPDTIAMKPQRIKRKREPFTEKQLQMVRERDEPINTLFAMTDCLTIDYDEMVLDRECIEIPEDVGRRLTDYLGVDYQPLRPQTRRPEYKQSE